MHASPITSPSRSRSSIAHGAATSRGIFIESVHLAAPSSQSAGGVGTHLGTGLHELSARLQNQPQDPGPQVDPDELMVYGDDSLPPHKLPPGPARTFSRGVGVQADEWEVVEADRRPSVRRDARPNRERHRSNQRRAQRSRGQPGSDHMYQTQLGRDSDAHSGDSRDSLRARMEEVRLQVSVVVSATARIQPPSSHYPHHPHHYALVSPIHRFTVLTVLYASNVYVRRPIRCPLARSRPTPTESTASTPTGSRARPTDYETGKASASAIGRSPSSFQNTSGSRKSRTGRGTRSRDRRQ